MPQVIRAANRSDSYYVLFVDTYGYRHQIFRVRSGKSNLHAVQRHCHSAQEMLQALNERDWDVIFIPGYFDRGERFNEVMEKFVTSIQAVENKPRLIVYHGLNDTDKGLEILKKLTDVPLAHIPWDYTNPSNHVRKVIK